MKLFRLFRSKNLLTTTLRNASNNRSSDPLFDEEALSIIDNILGFSGQEIMLTSAFETIANETYTLHKLSENKPPNHVFGASEKQSNHSRSVFLNSHEQDYLQTKSKLQNLIQNSQKERQEEDLNTANIYDELGMISHSETNLDDALFYFGKSLQIKETKLGKDHVETMTALQKIGVTYHSHGMFDEAIEYFQLALNQENNINDPLIISIYNNMMEAYQFKEDYEKALEVSQKALSLSVFENFKETLEGATFFETQGTIYYNLQQHDEAFEALNTSLQIYLYLGQANSLEVANVLQGIGLAKKALGKFEEALGHLNKSLKIFKKWTNPSPQDLTGLYHAIGSIYHENGEFEKAVSAYQKAANCQLNPVYRDENLLANIYYSCGLAQISRQEYSKALKSFKNCLELCLQNLGVHDETANSYFNIGVTNLHLKKYTQAADALSQALEIEMKLTPVKAVSIARIYDHLGKAHQGLERHDKALEFYEKGLETKIQVLGESHQDLGISYNHIGLVYFEQKDYQKSLYYFEKSLLIYSNTNQKNSKLAQQTWNLIEATNAAIKSSENSPKKIESVL